MTLQRQDGAAKITMNSSKKENIDTQSDGVSAVVVAIPIELATALSETEMEPTENPQESVSVVPLEIERADPRESGQQPSYSKALRKWALLVLILLICSCIFWASTRSSSSDKQNESSDEDVDDPAFGACHISPYVHLFDPATCQDLQNRYHPNAFWYNEGFTCRLQERPCYGSKFPWILDLGDGEYLDLQSGYGMGPGEVWVFHSDQYGRAKTQNFNTCFRFFAEGHWYDNRLPFGTDVNDYQFWISQVLRAARQ